LKVRKFGIMVFVEQLIHSYARVMIGEFYRKYSNTHARTHA